MSLVVLALVLGYLLGSIPFGLIIGRLFKGVDVRKYGSGKTGATNVMRTAGVLAGILVFVGDLGKGLISVFLAKAISQGDERVAAGAALVCIIGHNWPVFARFRGGRGVTTYLGGLVALSWIGGVIGGLAAIATIALTRYVSLGSLIGSLVSAGVIAYLVRHNDLHPAYFVYTSIGVIMLLVLHRDNIRRLATGRERKLGHRVELQESSEKTSESSHA